MTEFGSALMANPDMILLDEPSEGLAPMIVANLVGVLNTIRQKGITILLQTRILSSAVVSLNGATL